MDKLAIYQTVVGQVPSLGSADQLLSDIQLYYQKIMYDYFPGKRIVSLCFVRTYNIKNNLSGNLEKGRACHLVRLWKPHQFQNSGSYIC